MTTSTVTSLQSLRYIKSPRTQFVVQTSIVFRLCSLHNTKASRICYPQSNKNEYIYISSTALRCGLPSPSPHRRQAEIQFSWSNDSRDNEFASIDLFARSNV